MNKNNVVTKSNTLIDSRYSLSVQAQKLILACLAKYDSRPIGTPLKTVSMSAFEYSELMGIDIKNAHRELYKAADSLFKSSITLIEDGEETEIYWVQEKSKKIKGEGAVSLIWSDRVTKYISQLQSNFTSYKLNDISNLQSSHSIRIYEILMRFKSTGHRILTVDQLRLLLDIKDKYPLYKDFSKWVIRPSIAELNEHSSMQITFEPILKGRKTVALSFKFKPKSTIKRAEEQLSLDIICDEQASYNDELHEEYLQSNGPANILEA